MNIVTTQENFFNEYNIEGVTPEHNEIYLEFSPDKMYKVKKYHLYLYNPNAQS